MVSQDILIPSAVSLVYSKDISSLSDVGMDSRNVTSTVPTHLLS